MCGRFSLRARNAAILAEYFDIVDVPLLKPRYNIAPSQPVPAVQLKLGQTKLQRELVLLRWGLIPGWANDPAIGNRMINARAESLAQKPAFRAALRQRRCLIAADGFYEWQGTGRSRQPYFIHFRDDRPFAFAGLWESWEGPDHTAIDSCTIITTAAGDLIRPIHDRMPVILPPEAYEVWLDPAVKNINAIAALLVPFSSPEMEAYPVNTLVNKASRDGPECVEPLKNLF
ncbi:MAG: SOS response-associated peptidase [Thermoguttaceae bacterium]|jgi:putative SOS response-associated peptidase YedK